MPAEHNLVIDPLPRSIDFPIDLLLAISPELLPGEDLRIVQQQPPERDEIAIARTLILPRSKHKLIQLDEALPSSLDCDSAFFSLLPAMLAKAGDLRTAIEPAVTRADCIVERPLSFRSPHHPINFV